VITSEPWGTADGQAVELYTLSNGRGMTVRVATYGATVQSVLVPDRFGEVRNVALGFPSVDGYVGNFMGVVGAGSGPAYFGAIVGRYANRIAGRSFVLDGERYELAGGPDDAVTMHGGPGGYSERVWEAACVPGVAGSALRLVYVDPAGRNGFPGTVRVAVVYAVTPDNALRIDYTAVADAATVVNLTNHTYFNLAGEGSGDVYDQLLALNAGVFQPVDDVSIPVGFSPVEGTPFDFRVMKPIGRDIRSVGGGVGGRGRGGGGGGGGRGEGGGGRGRGEGGGDQLAIARGYDHNWVLAGVGYRLAAVALSDESGIALWTYTDQPGVQFYTSNFLVGDVVGTGGFAYRQGDAFALETQHFPDSPHHIGEEGWPSVVLRPGEVLRTRTTYKFGVAGPELAERVRF
jgi:aldose 1-epimerase